MTTDLEDRLEELFMHDANGRRVSSVGVPRRTSVWRGVIAFTAAAAALALVAIAAIAMLRGDPQSAAPSATSTPLATATPAATATSPAAAMGTVTGRIAHGGDFGYPALTLYALPVNDTADGRYHLRFERSAGRPELVPDRYTMSVPAGTYYFIAYSRLLPGDVFPPAGGYTPFAACGADRSCGTHELSAVTVTAGQTVSNIDITDWFLSPTGYPPEPRSSSGATYDSPLGYSVQLPAGWRRSDAVSRTTPFAPGQGDPDQLGSEYFTRRTPEDEATAIRRTDTGVGPALVYTASASLYRNSRNLSAMAYADREKGALGLIVVSIEPTTVDGRAGAKTTFKFMPNDTQTFYALYVPDGERMWVIRYFLAYPTAEVPAGATEQDVRSIVESFRFRQ